jgi:hypothetical protein
MAERYQVRGRRIWDSSNDSYSQLFPSADMAEWALKNNGKSIVFQPLDQWQDDKPNGDAVNRPDHYTQGPVECIDAIEAAMSTDQFIGFLRGQVIKYAWRLGLKGEAVEDARKGTWYFTRLIKTLEK